jgi:hypothetical protein
MKCYRCGGIMVHEKVYSKAELLGIWKCVLCGEYVDRVILENRQYQKAIRENSRRKKKPSEMQAALSLTNPAAPESLPADPH